MLHFNQLSYLDDTSLIPLKPHSIFPNPLLCLNPGCHHLLLRLIYLFPSTQDLKAFKISFKDLTWLIWLSKTWIWPLLPAQTTCHVHSHTIQSSYIELFSVPHVVFFFLALFCLHGILSLFLLPSFAWLSPTSELLFSRIDCLPTVDF